MSPRRTATYVGALFLIAMVASLTGGSMVQAGLDLDAYPASGASTAASVTLGALLELVNALAVVGIAALMYPLLRGHGETAAIAYVALRTLEAVFCSIIVVGPLAAVALMKSSATANALPPATARGVAALAMAQRDQVMRLLIPIAFGFGTLLFYPALLRSRLVPRFIAVWGLVGAALILALTLLLALGMIEHSVLVQLAFAFPIITNEVFLGVWLMAKGFRPQAVALSAP